jgi:hypothetical protein
MQKVKIDSYIYKQAKKTAEHTGYSTIEEFIENAIIREINRLDQPHLQTEESLSRQLRGLGYIE